MNLYVETNGWRIASPLKCWNFIAHERLQYHRNSYKIFAFKFLLFLWFSRAVKLHLNNSCASRIRLCTRDLWHVRSVLHFADLCYPELVFWNFVFLRMLALFFSTYLCVVKCTRAIDWFCCTVAIGLPTHRHCVCAHHSFLFSALFRFINGRTCRYSFI